MRACAPLSLILACLVLTACGSAPRREVPAPTAKPPLGAPPAPPVAGATPPVTGAVTPAPRRGGAYYQDDGPGANPPPNLEATPDAAPADVPPLRSAANRPYVVFGKTYTPAAGNAPFRQRGTGSWYGRKFHGQRTSSGEPYDMYAMTAAHPTLPLPSWVRVTSVANGRSVVVKVNDRGPFHSERIIDLSYTAALKLGYANQGSAVVDVERVYAGDATSAPLVAGAPGARPQAQPAVTTAGQPATEATAVLPVSTHPDGMYLQLGAFGAREGAEEFRVKTYQQLPWLNETMYIVARDRLYRVQLGPYPDRGVAQAIADRIREALQLKPVFVLR